VQINYASSDLVAIAGLDYVAMSGVLSIPAGSSSVVLEVRIIGDLLNEGNERFNIDFSNPVNVVIGGDSKSTVMIIDNDHGKNNHPVTKIINNENEEPGISIPTVVKMNHSWLLSSFMGKEGKVQIINITGQVVLQTETMGMPVVSLRPGMYFYQIGVTEKNGIIKYYRGKLWVIE
jgi:hypothetical protein